MISGTKVCTYMSELSPETLRRLAEKLDVIQPSSHNWRTLLSIIEHYCRRNYQDYEIEDFAKEIATIDGSPSAAFLRDLVKQRTPVTYLKDALKAMKHVSALEMLGVREQPSITTQPKSFNEGIEGTSLTITCKGYGIPRPNYQWFKNNNHIWVEIAYPAQRADLHFQYLSHEDSGVYQCLLRNEVGEIRTKECSLKVITRDRSVSRPIEYSQAFTLMIVAQVPQEIRIPINSLLEIKFEVSPNIGCEYMWYYKPPCSGLELTHIARENVCKLVRQHATYDHEGIYCCIISNRYDKKQSEYCSVTIESQNDFSRRSTNPALSYPSSNVGSKTLPVSKEPPRAKTYSNMDEAAGSDSGYSLGSSDRYISKSISGVRPRSRSRGSSLDHNDPSGCTSEADVIKEAAPGQTISLNHYSIKQDLHHSSEYKWFFIPLKDLNCKPIFIPCWKEKDIELTVTSDTDYGWYYCEQHAIGHIIPSATSKVCPPITIASNCRDKVALLIGNQKYREDVFTLHLPESDTRDLAGYLRSLGFRVVTLVNLSSKEMYTAIEHFLCLLNTGVYALFFYGGHGFELDSENYLMGVECSREFTTEHCVPASWVQQKIATRNAKLNMMILDMCRTKVITKGDARPVLNCLINPNLLNAFHIIAYSCSPSCMAFERRADDNSIYMTELLKCIGEKKPIHNLLFEVAGRVEKVGRDQGIPAEKWMRPYYTSNITEELTLHDPIDMSGSSSSEYQAIIRKWQEAHHHPMPRTINSENGVVVLRLHFDAEFSNVLIVAIEFMKGTLLHTNNVKLKEVLVYQNVETIAITIPMKCEDITNNSCSLTKIENLLGTYRVPDLQKFQNSLKFHFVIEYEYESELICETISFVPTPPPLYSNLIYGQIGCEH